MHSVQSARRREIAFRAVLAIAVAMAISLFTASHASAATQYYCSGCLLGAYGTTQSAPHGLSTLNYGHRLSSGGTMVVYTWSSYFGQVICSSGLTSATEATCDPAGYSVIGVVQNGSGASRYYNAHLNYG